MAGDEKNIALDTLPAGRFQPIGAPMLYQFDKLKIVLGQATAEYFLFVGRIDRDRAHRFLVGACIVSPNGDQECGQEDKFRGSRHAQSR
jgi:hypothetical protein